jgi:hypothetical protein
MHDRGVNVEPEIGKRALSRTHGRHYDPSTMGGKSRTLAAAMTMASMQAFAQLHDIAWDARGGAALRVQVQPGKVLEWCGALNAGDDVHWEFEAGDTLEMNVHYHEGAAVVFPAATAEAESRSGRLRPAAQQTYCWMWTNHRAAPVALQAKLQKALR